jgi:hypothetical protein
MTGKLKKALSGDEDAEPKIRTGLDPDAVVANDHDVPPNSPAGRKVSVLGVEVVDRGQWSGPLDFLMSMIAYAVGLGKYFVVEFN